VRTQAPLHDAPRGPGLAASFERRHQPLIAQRLRSEARGVPERFFPKYAIPATLQTWAVVYDVPTPDGRGALVVPPKDVPTWIVCSQRVSEGLRCRALTGATAVPLGGAVYAAFPGFKGGQINSSWPRARLGPRADHVPARSRSTFGAAGCDPPRSG